MMASEGAEWSFIKTPSRRPRSDKAIAVALPFSPPSTSHLPLVLPLTATPRRVNGEARGGKRAR